jgi:hypothetical protein
MPDIFDLSITSDALDEMADLAGATDRQFDTARARALRKLQTTIETKIKREASRKLNLPQRAIGDRFFSNNIQPGDEELKVWVGTWDIEPFSIGAVSQSKFGVRVGRRSYPGAFLARIYSGKEKVWIRLHSKHYSSDLYPTRKRPGDRGLQPLKGRFPVVRASVPIDEIMAEVIDNQSGFFAAQFKEIFQRELNYEVNIKGRG